MNSDNESVQSIHTDDENDLERVVEGAENEDGTVEVQRDQSDDEQKEAERKEVKPKRVIRNPQPKLNDQALIGPRGIASLEKYFERVKFKGKGHEQQDLDVLLKTYEYWCHRLFPKFPFETCIEKIEKLGHKKPVITHIKRIRYDLMLNDAVSNDQAPESDEEAAEERNKAPSQETQEQLFDNLVRNEEPVQLTEEQLERIRKNKERAEKLRRERLQRAKEKASTILSQEEKELATNEETEGANLDGIYKQIEEEISANPDLFLSQENTENRNSQTDSGENIEEEKVEMKKRRKKIAVIESDESDDEQMTSQLSNPSQGIDIDNVNSQSSENSSVSSKSDKENLSNNSPMDVDFEKTGLSQESTSQGSNIEDEEENVISSQDNIEIASQLSNYNQELEVNDVNSQNSDNLTVSGKSDEENLLNECPMDLANENEL